MWNRIGVEVVLLGTGSGSDHGVMGVRGQMNKAAICGGEGGGGGAGFSYDSTTTPHRHRGHDEQCTNVSLQQEKY